MAQTPGRYKWPVPALTDLADGPDGFNKLGSAVETTVTGIDDRTASVETLKTGSPFDVKVGAAADTTQRILVVQRLVGTDLWEMRFEVDSATDPFVLQSLKNGVAITRLSLQASGQLNVNGGSPAAWRPMPFAVTTAFVNVPVGGVSYGTKTFNWPAGRFVQPPIIVLASTNSIWNVGITTPNDATQCTIYARSYNNSNGGAGGKVGVHAHAIQMLPSAGAEVNVP